MKKLRFVPPEYQAELRNWAKDSSPIYRTPLRGTISPLIPASGTFNTSSAIGRTPPVDLMHRNAAFSKKGASLVSKKIPSKKEMMRDFDPDLYSEIYGNEEKMSKSMPPPRDPRPRGPIGYPPMNPPELQRANFPKMKPNSMGGGSKGMTKSITPPRNPGPRGPIGYPPLKPPAPKSPTPIGGTPGQSGQYGGINPSGMNSKKKPIGYDHARPDNPPLKMPMGMGKAQGAYINDGTVPVVKGGCKHCGTKVMKGEMCKCGGMSKAMTPMKMKPPVTPRPYDPAKGRGTIGPKPMPGRNNLSYTGGSATFDESAQNINNTKPIQLAKPMTTGMSMGKMSKNMPKQPKMSMRGQLNAVRAKNDAQAWANTDMDSANRKFGPIVVNQNAATGQIMGEKITNRRTGGGRGNPMNKALTGKAYPISIPGLTGNAKRWADDAPRMENQNNLKGPLTYSQDEKSGKISAEKIGYRRFDRKFGGRGDKSGPMVKGQAAFINGHKASINKVDSQRNPEYINIRNPPIEDKPGKKKPLGFGNESFSERHNKTSPNRKRKDLPMRELKMKPDDKPKAQPVMKSADCCPSCGSNVRKGMMCKCGYR